MMISFILLHRPIMGQAIQVCFTKEVLQVWMGDRLASGHGISHLTDFTIQLLTLTSVSFTL